MAQQVTTMVIKVDLACDKCRKKIKKILCDIPQIQNQVYDEKANTVTITVVCCSPEKVKKKICCKGGKTVKGIEILKPSPPPKPKEAPKPKEPEKPKEGPDPGQQNEPPVVVVVNLPKEAPKATAPTPKAPKPVAEPLPRPGGFCCSECYEGVGGGPCWAGYGRPAGPCYYGGYGRPVYESWGGGCNRGYYPSRCTDYICEENPNAACTIM